MLNAVLVIVGAVLAWMLVDGFVSRRQQRLQRGHAAWLHETADRTFHSTGWEETVSPLEALEPIVQRPRSRQSGRAAA